MAKLMVMIDVPELSYEEMRKAMLGKKECRLLVDFAHEKGSGGLATVSIDAECIRRCRFGPAPAQYLFELIGVRP